METNTMKVGYRLVRNATSTAEKAPYFGVAVPVGSLAYGNILQRMLDRGTYMTRATAQYCLNEFYEYAAKVIADDIVRINMGSVSIYPMIGGPFDSEDDTYREPRNTLYIGATLSQELRNAVTGLVPENLVGIAVGTVQISSVMDLASETYHLIDGLKEFRIAGIDLTVPDGEDESLALVAADGVTKVADIMVVSTRDGQRIVCTLASAVPAGTYHVRLVSHGLDPTAPIVTALHKVTVKAAAVTPAPDLTEIHSFGHGEDTEHIYEGASVELIGTALNGATVKVERLEGVWKDEVTIPADKLEVTDTKIVIDGEWLADEYAIPKDVAFGDSMRITVTTPGGSDMIASIWEENV